MSIKHLGAVVKARLVRLNAGPRDNTLTNRKLSTTYNFIRPHEALNGYTPAEMAGLDLELGENKWLDLINKATADQKEINEIKNH